MTPAGLEAEAERQHEEHERMLALRDSDMEALEALAPDMESAGGARLAADERVLGDVVVSAASQLTPGEFEVLGDFLNEYDSADEMAEALDLALRGDNEQSRKLEALGQARDESRSERVRRAEEQRPEADGADKPAAIDNKRCELRH